MSITEAMSGRGKKLELRHQQLTKNLMIEVRVYKRHIKIVTRVEKDKMKASIMRLRRELSAVQKLIQARKKTEAMSSERGKGGCKSSSDFIDLVRECIFKSSSKKFNMDTWRKAKICSHMQLLGRLDLTTWLDFLRMTHGCDARIQTPLIEIQPDALKNMYFVFIRCRPTKKWIDAAVKSIIPDILLLLSITHHDKVRDLFRITSKERKFLSTTPFDDFYNQIEKNAQLLLNVTYVLIDAAEFSIQSWKQNLEIPYFLQGFTNVFFKDQKEILIMDREKPGLSVFWKIIGLSVFWKIIAALYNSNNNRQLEVMASENSNSSTPEEEGKFVSTIYNMQRHFYQRLKKHVAEYIKNNIPIRAASIIQKAWLHRHYKPGGSGAKRAIARAMNRNEYQKRRRRPS